MSQDQLASFEIDSFDDGLPAFSVDLKFESDRIVVAAHGQLDLDSRTTFVDALARAIASDHPEIVVDLADLRGIDSEAVALFVRAQRLLQARGQRLFIQPATTNSEVLFASGLLDRIALADKRNT